MAAAKHAIDRENFSFQLSGNPAQSEKQDLLCISKTTAVSFWKKTVSAKESDTDFTSEQLSCSFCPGQLWGELEVSL